MSDPGPSVAPGGPGWRVWLEAARPRTLPASIVPVLVGTAASERAAWAIGGPPAVDSAEGLAPLLSIDVSIDWVRFLLAMVVALSLQVAVNFANDWFDGVRGVDTPERVGPRRVTASGLVTPQEIRFATFMALAVAASAGLTLAILVDLRLLLVGVAAVLAALGYSGGPRPYASVGLGEVAVFVFFGLVATVGSQFVQDEIWSWDAFVAGCAVGLYAVALLVVNNLRDIPTDALAGKRTLAVRIGEPATRGLYIACIVAAHLLVLALMAMTSAGWVALPLLSLPLVAPAIRLVRGAPIGPDLIEALGRTARAQLVFGVLLTLGLALRDPTLGQVIELVE